VSGTGSPPESTAVAPPAVDSRVGFQQAIAWGFKTAAEAGARQIVCVDPGFVDWPLNDPELFQVLTPWLRQPQRRLVLLAAHYDAMPRHFPRFELWRKNWSHAIEAWQPPPDMALEWPTLLVAAPLLTVHLIDRPSWRGRASLDPRAAQRHALQIDAVLQRCERAYAVDTLGL
jgi:hypothetical protein